MAIYWFSSHKFQLCFKLNIVVICQVIASPKMKNGDLGDISGELQNSRSGSLPARCVGPNMYWSKKLSSTKSKKILISVGTSGLELEMQ